MEAPVSASQLNGVRPKIAGSLRSNGIDESPASRYALQAIQLLEEGQLQPALQLLNICLGDTDDTEGADLDAQVSDLLKIPKKSANGEESKSVSVTDESSLVEKRCLLNLKLKRYSKTVQDAKKMISFSAENSVAYKCLLISLCKMKKLEQANEVIKLWQKSSPRDLEMMECRTKLESLLVAVKNGIEASDAFSDIEDLLGLNVEWLLLRKSKDPQWKYRALPTSSRCSFVLCLQYRFGHCSLGEKCPDAHGEAELEEWKKRSEIENTTKKISTMKIDDGSVYLKDLLTAVQSDNHNILSENDTEDVKIACASSLHTTVQQRKFKKFTWKFTVKTTKPITHICLLHEHHRQYFHISSCSLVGPKDSIVLNQSGKTEPSAQVLVPQLSQEALAIAGEDLKCYTYKVKVVFTPEVYGNFRQTVVFDLGSVTKTVRNVSVDVVPPADTDVDTKSGVEHSSSPIDRSKGFRNNIPWNFGNADMVDSNTGEKMPSEKLGFALITSASITRAESFMENTKDPLSKEHYKERMRFLLTQEERSRQEILAKYNVTTNVYLSEKYVVTGGYNEGMARYAVDGTLYGRISLFRDISEDTAVGRLILRSCNAVLITKSEESRKAEYNSKIRVYFCPVSDKTKNSVYLDIGRTCVSELDLKDGDVIQFDIQFQLDRTAFIEQKKVIDLLSGKHLDMLFPDLEIKCNIPWSPIKQWSEIETSGYRLNPKQKEALIAITAENCPTPPILVIGPFGSGKTFTLAQCIRKILTQTNSRVMVCTHSNSAADLYIKEYLDSWVQQGFTEARPLRIYYEMRNLNSVHPVVLKYCTIEAMKFRPPTYEEVMSHRVIVVTLSTSYLLMEMTLPEDTFSHILLDEAAQAMESEAICPLMSAGRKTKLVLAGDHFQLSPELFSEEARNIHPSLLERLHALYPDTHPCKLMLCENYRSHSAIIQFVSESFYTKKLECAKSQPVHDNFFPLTFFAARGEDVQDSESTSYYNMAEVFELTEKISELISSWPEKWGDYRDENAIGVLTPYADQVTRIRSRLRKKGLHSVSVERVFNVQGKQFRAVFLSTVRTFRPWVRILPEAVGNEVDLGFFSSPKLLNTALTRAQSLVAVVGDPVSLCSVGKCRRIWEDYIRICHESKSLFGITFLQLKQSILGVEMRLTWGLNPLANEFQPQQANKLPIVSAGAGTSMSLQYQPNTTSYQSQVNFQLGKGRHRAPTYVEQQAGYSGYQQAFPDPNLPPQHAFPVLNNGLYHPGSQYYSLRQPYHTNAGMAPNFSPGVPPPTLPYHQAYPPSMPIPNVPQVVPHHAAIHAQIHAGTGFPPRTPQFHHAAPVLQPSYPTYNGQGSNGQPFYGQSPLTSGSTVGNDVIGTQNNAIYNPRTSTVTPQQFATGQPLYRRAPVTSNPQPLGLHTAQPQVQAPFESRMSLNPSVHADDHLGLQVQPKLTQEELNYIAQALQIQSTDTGPGSGEIQMRIQMKLMQAISSGGDAMSARLPVHLNGQQQPSSVPHMYGGVPTNINPPLEQYAHAGYQHSVLASTSNATIPTNNQLYAPIPQKSPANIVPSDRLNYPSYLETSSTTKPPNNPWSNPGTSFPSVPDGGITHGQMLPHHTNERASTFNEAGARFHPQLPTQSIYPAVNQQSQLSTRHVGGPNVMYPNNEYGYQADVGSGLKAQLSGGLRQQGFGERSAFSRVNGSHDVDVSEDTSNLGRSYANVVKAAVTTAAVGSGLSTTSMSMATSNMNRSTIPPSAQVPSQGIFLNANLSNAKFYYGAGAPFHNTYGAHGP